MGMRNILMTLLLSSRRNRCLGSSPLITVMRGPSGCESIPMGIKTSWARFKGSKKVTFRGASQFRTDFQGRLKMSRYAFN